MAKSSYDVLEIRFRFEPAITHAYVRCGPPSDGMLGVQGWHHKAFPSSVPASDILAGDIAHGLYLTEWGAGVPWR